MGLSEMAADDLMVEHMKWSSSQQVAAGEAKGRVVSMMWPLLV
jgi:hypothetical protein